MWVKLVVVLFLVVIVYCLGSGLVYLVSDRGDSDRVVKALTWRIVLSLLLFALLFLAYAMGWIQPHGV